MIHHIKTVEPFFTDTKEGRKTFELRINDRNYLAGDMADLMQFVDGKLTGQSVYVDIVYVLDDFAGIKPGYCILGIRLLPPQEENT